LEAGYYNKETKEYTITGVNIKAGPERYFAYANNKGISVTGMHVSSNYNSANGSTDALDKKNAVGFSITMQMSSEQIAEFRSAMISEKTPIGTISSIGFGFNSRDTYGASASEVLAIMGAGISAATSFAPNKKSDYNLISNSCVTHVIKAMEPSTLNKSYSISPWEYASEMRILNHNRYRGGTTR
jgi:hypothetical protein